MVQLIILIYLLIGVSFVLFMYNDLQKLCIKYINEVIEEDSYYYAQININILNICVRYMPFVYIILWPCYLIQKAY